MADHAEGDQNQRRTDQGRPAVGGKQQPETARQWQPERGSRRRAKDGINRWSIPANAVPASAAA
jgi:hypothetical protein